MQTGTPVTSRVRLLYSPFNELLTSLHVLVYPSPRYVHAVPWVLRIRPALPAAMRRQIDQYGAGSNLWLWTMVLLRPGMDPTASVPQMLKALRELPLAAFLCHFAAHRLGDEAAIAAWLDGGPPPAPAPGRGESPELWQRLLADPAAERERVLELLEQYHQQVFAGELAAREPVLIRYLAGLAHQLHSANSEQEFLAQVCERVRFAGGQMLIHKQSEIQQFDWSALESVYVMPSTFVNPHLASGGGYGRVLLSFGPPYLSEPGRVPPDQAVKALADSTRLRILRRLMAGESTTQELASQFRLAEATVSRHLMKLKAAGLVSTRKEFHYMYYLGNPSALEAVLETLRRYLMQRE